LIKTILADWGLNVSIASNGKEAIEEVKKEKFDLILMDMQMPIMDGYSACLELTENKCEIPIVALTASAMKEDRERCLKAGCRDYLSKPIQKAVLLQTIKKNMEPATA
jgi:CheY-like chemotaxis protein